MGDIIDMGDTSPTWWFSRDMRRPGNLCHVQTARSPGSEAGSTVMGSTARMVSMIRRPWPDSLRQTQLRDGGRRPDVLGQERIQDRTAASRLVRHVH